MKRTILALAAVFAGGLARAEVGEEIDVTAGVVTGLRCALEARDTGDLTRLSSCPPGEAAKGMVVYDIADERIFALSKKKVYRWQLESAYGGGSIDFVGVAVKVDPETEVATVDVQEYSVTKKKKPGHFKGCL